MLGPVAAEVKQEQIEQLTEQDEILYRNFINTFKTKIQKMIAQRH